MHPPSHSIQAPHELFRYKGSTLQENCAALQTSDGVDWINYLVGKLKYDTCMRCTSMSPDHKNPLCELRETSVIHLYAAEIVEKGESSSEVSLVFCKCFE
jgi:hypothetical protein